MAKLPDAPVPATAPYVAPALRVVAEGTLLWRIYFRGGAHPTTWNEFRSYGPLRAARFDHHELPARVQARAILYAAKSVQTCLAEAFQEPRKIHTHRREPWLVGFRLRRAITSLDLTGEWTTRVGASAAINSGPRPRARGWSRLFYSRYPEVEGLLYCSSMNGNAPALALYERAADALADAPVFERPLGDSSLKHRIRAAAERIGYDVITGLAI